MRTIRIAGTAELPFVEQDLRDEAELVNAVTTAVLADAGVPRKEVGFTCSGSSDYHMGRPFSFVLALDGIGAWPPIRESHVEMDGAFALYEAWVRLQHGDVDVALVYSYGKSSVGDMDAIASLQLDPYYQSPLGIGPADLAAMQRQALLDAGAFSELSEGRTPGRDGAAATVLVADGTRYAKGPRIAHLQHRTDAMDVGRRGLLRARSAQLASEGMGSVDAAFVHTPFGYQAALLARELGLSEVTPSEAEIPMVSGLANLNRAARAGVRALGHCTSGPCLQQNLVCVVEPYVEGA